MSKREPYKSCTVCTFGYCAPLRCYCGHSECSAYASYIKPATIAPTKTLKADERQAQTWAEREEPTWLDR